MPNDNDIITSAIITGMPKGFADFSMPKVIATTEAGETVELFWYYPDELSFTPGEFVGRTIADGRRMKYDKDVRFLRS